MSGICMLAFCCAILSLALKNETNYKVYKKITSVFFIFFSNLLSKNKQLVSEDICTLGVYDLLPSPG
jgi:hypothetical protein